MSGQVAPGSGGKSFDAVFWPVINNSGQIAFFGHLPTPTVFNARESSLYMGTIGSAMPVATIGQTAPGTQAVYSQMDLSSPLLNDSGQIAYRAILSDGNTGLFAGSPNAPTAIAIAGQPSPVAGATFSSVGRPVFVGHGQISFSSALSGSGYSPNNWVLWAGSLQSPSVVAAQGTAAPGFDGRNLYAQTDYSAFPSFPAYGIAPPSMNRSGQLVFATPLVDAATNSPAGGAVFYGTTASVTPILRPGDVVDPRLPTVKTWAFGNPVINDSGQIAVGAALSPSFPRSLSGYDTIYTGKPGNFSPVAYAGAPVPGRPGQQISTFFDPLISNNGQIVFRALYANGGASGLFETDGSGGLKSLALDGNSTYGPGDPYFQFEINGQGQVAFLFQTSQGKGLWATDPAGNVQKIAMVGDVVDTDGGSLKTIRDVAMMAYEPAGYAYHQVSAPSFNDNGLLAYSVTFTDGSDAVYVAMLPEPGVTALVLGAAVLLSRRRR